MHSAVHTYSNLSRLFIRLFVGIMFMQFGIRQLMNFENISAQFPDALGMSHEMTLVVMIVIEIFGSLMIMAGFLTRLACIPSIISMIIAEKVILTEIVHQVPYTLASTQPGYLPVMFIGIFIFIILAGPGKVSLDYLISLHFLNYSSDENEEEALKEA